MSRIPFIYQNREIGYMDFDMSVGSGDMYSTAGYSTRWIGRVVYDSDGNSFHATNSRTGRMATFRVEDNTLIFNKSYHGDRISQDEFCVYLGFFDD